MHESYDDNDEDYDEYDYDNLHKDKYQWYYKFDVGPDNPISKWMDELVQDFINNNSQDFNVSNNIPGFEIKKFPVNSWNPDAAKSKNFQYLGSNYQGSPIWKSKYFIVDKLNNEYKLHLQSHASHFVKQPSYYKGIFDILN